jgi:hypothetical protein
LESVEKCGGAFAAEISGGEGSYDLGEGELDRFGVVEVVKLDVIFAMEAAGGGPADAEVPVALVESIVEETIAAALERGRLALNTICLDVVAERDIDSHGFLLWRAPRGVFV